MKFKETILQANPILNHVPRGYKRYDDVMILRSPHQLSSELGNTIISVYPWCRSVYQHQTTRGQSRIPLLVHLAGEDNPEVMHRENGVIYQIDLSRITFSGGNRYLRERLVETVQDGEFLLDMFAAVGNLSLQPLIYCDINALLIERNPYTYSYLTRSLELNNQDPNIAHNMDCRSLTHTDIADRIFLGYHEVDSSHLKTAVAAAKSTCFLHLHPIAPADDYDRTISHFRSLLNKLVTSSQISEIHTVKDYSPGLEHIELVFQITK